MVDEICMPNVLLKCAFGLREDNLNVVHINIQSLRPKIDELRKIILNTDTHIVAISETWLKKHISSRSVSIPGYQLLRDDRSRIRGGGVALFIKSNLRARIVSSGSGNTAANKCNYLLIELIFPNSKLLVGVFYQPPGTFDQDFLSDLIMSLAPHYSDIILTGDFNVNLLDMSNNVRNNRFLNVFNPVNISVVNTEPTYFHSTGSSMLDLFLTNNPNEVTLVNQIDSGLATHHDILILSYK